MRWTAACGYSSPGSTARFGSSSSDITSRASIAQLNFLLRHLGALLARLRKPDRDRLLAALHHAAFAALAGTQLAALLKFERSFHALAGSLPIFRHVVP